MLNTVHFSVGMAIGRYAPHPLVALLLGFISHFVLDAVPHWDGSVGEFTARKIHWNRIILLLPDFIASAVVGVLAWQWGWLGLDPMSWGVLAGAFGSLLPDMLWVPYFFMGLRWPQRLFGFHYRIQREVKFIYAIVPQTGLVVLAMWLLWN